MRIIDKIEAHKGKFLSLEFFPPKDPDTWPGFMKTAGRLAELDPLFVSVTYGAGGTTQNNTLEIVSRIRGDLGLIPMAHLTCVGAEEQSILEFVDALKEADVHDVLALRGDPPRDQPDFTFQGKRFQHATDLVELLRDKRPEMGVAATAYPEPHPESPSVKKDLEISLLKQKCGAQLLVTQLFFDNRLYFDMVGRLQDMGLVIPVLPGVLPLLSLKSAKFILSLCGAAIPGKLLASLEKAHEEGGDEAVFEMGLDHAARQAQELLDGGAPGVHLYTLNRAEPCLRIGSRLKL